MSTEACTRLLFQDETLDSTSLPELQKALEKDDDEVKLDALRKVINLMLQGEPCSQMLMPVIRFALPSKNKNIKKASLQFLEHCETHGPDGKLKHEMILVCNALRNDLQHPNEYVRGGTLRFISTIQDSELAEPLVPAALACLSYRHPYVRRYAFFALSHLALRFEHLLPDCAESLLKTLMTETDSAARTSGILALVRLSPRHAAQTLVALAARIKELTPPVQMAFIETIKRLCPLDDKLIHVSLAVLNDLLKSTSSMIKLEAASVLSKLSQSDASLSIYVSLLGSESDNNVKLVLLEKISGALDSQVSFADHLASDVLRGVNSSDSKIQEKAVKLALSMSNSRNISDVLSALSKELSKHSPDAEDPTGLKAHLVNGISQAFKAYPSLVADHYESLVNHLADKNINAAVECAKSLHSIALSQDSLREKIAEKMVAALSKVSSVRVCRFLLYDLGSLHLPSDRSEKILCEIIRSSSEKEENLQSPSENSTFKNKILADGTYATDSAILVSKSSSQSTGINQFFKDGHFLIAAVVATTVVKLLGRLQGKVQNQLGAECILLLSNILKYGLSEKPLNKIDGDSLQHLLRIIRLIGQRKFELIPSSAEEFTETAQVRVDSVMCAVDVPINFGIESSSSFVDFDSDLERAIKSDQENLKSRAENVVQLTGLSDDIYIEAYLNQTQFDISCEVLLVNQTADTLRNVSVDFCPIGGVKVITRPLVCSIAPQSFELCKAAFKVISPGEGSIHGSVSFEGSAHLSSKAIPFAPIELDISSFVEPNRLNESQFRIFWVGLEWENKMLIDISADSLDEFMDYLSSHLNLSLICKQPREGHGKYFIATLSAKSSNGQDILCNLCFNRTKDGRITGHCRIRSQLKGIVQRIGEKLSVIAMK